MAFEGGTASELAKRRAESPTSELWMEEVCEREAEGYRWVVDLDLEKFFDRVNHDRLLAKIAEGSAMGVC